MDRQVVLVAVDDLCLVINSKVDNLYAEDERQGLYLRSENKAKDTIVYPDIFHGVLGDNIYKFEKKFKEAVFKSQVMKSDQVKTLQKYLGGEAKERCGDHYTDLESVLTALAEYYGDASLIWTKMKNEFESSIANGTQVWGKYGD